MLQLLVIITMERSVITLSLSLSLSLSFIIIFIIMQDMQSEELLTLESEFPSWISLSAWVVDLAVYSL